MSAVLAPAPAAIASLPPIRVRAKFFFEGDRKWFIKGVTYGPFAPDADGRFRGRPGEGAARFRHDARTRHQSAARLSHPAALVARSWRASMACACSISIPWAEHIEFLNNRQDEAADRRDDPRRAWRRTKATRRSSATRRQRDSVLHRALARRAAGHRVRRESHQRRARDRSAAALQLRQLSADGVSAAGATSISFRFNVYLERQRDFEKYLARLQNLAEDKPLIFGEFGLDTIRKARSSRWRCSTWHLESVVRGGAAGTIFFAWTDEWFTGGSEITDWAFGLVTRDREPKKAFDALKEYLRLRGLDHRAREAAAVSEGERDRVQLQRRQDAQATASSRSMRCIYPGFEIVLVDDGSKDDSQAIVRAWLERRRARFREVSSDEVAAAHHGQHPEARVEVYPVAGKLPGFVWIVQPNMGLSYARNAGAAAARGEVFAYTDSDCMADPDWLYYMVGTLLSGDYVGVGGPNISPPAVNWIQAAVSAAPGGPSHVLLTDVVAEHIPGCNMAFHRAGVREHRRLRHRVSQGRRRRGFLLAPADERRRHRVQPGAIVWHYRRFTLTAFRKQQEGYGEAESMLRFKHLIFFGPTGTAKWKGQIYGAPRFNWFFNRPIIYHGVFGHGPVSVDLSRAAERARGLSQQHRMGRAHRVHRGARLAAREAAHGAAG